MILELHVAAMPGCPDPIEVVAMAQAKAPPGWTVLAHAEEAVFKPLELDDTVAAALPPVGCEVLVLFPLGAQWEDDGEPYAVFIDNNLGSKPDYLRALCRELVA